MGFPNPPVKLELDHRFLRKSPEESALATRLMLEQRDLLKTKTAAISRTSIRQERRGEDGKRHECRGAIILRYQRRTERVDEAILRFLSEAASRSIVILRVLASSAVIRVRAFPFSRVLFGDAPVRHETCAFTRPTYFSEGNEHVHRNSRENGTRP